MSKIITVSNLSIGFMVVSLFLAVFFPVILGIYFYRKEKISGRAVLVGVLVFFVFQVITRIPLLGFLPRFAWYRAMASNPVALGLFLGLTAGLFEEVGRFIGFKYFLASRLEWKNGVAYGIGHGGIEAILLVGLGYINNIIMSIMINAGAFGALVGAKLPPETAQQILNSLVDMPSYVFLIGGIERVFAILVQIALSLVVLYGVMEKRKIYLLYAILFHTLLNAPVVVMSMSKVHMLGIEAYVLICAVISLVFIVKSRRLFEKKHQIVYAD